MAVKKKGRKKKNSGWGGRRPGAGRPKGSGTGPSPDSRRNRIAIMLRDTELGQLTKLASKSKEPVATAAYRILSKNLKRAR
jgi:hypothetical protein